MHVNRLGIYIILIVTCNFASAQTTFDGLDLYGSTRIGIRDIQSSYAEVLQTCAREFFAGPTLKFFEQSQSFETELIKKYDLANASLSVIRYTNLHNISGSSVYATIDVVEKDDAARRMIFTPRPLGHHEDPAGLLQAWDDYQKIGIELLRKGEISGLRPQCPAFHCIFGHEHPQLKPFETIFIQGVRTHKDKLIQIFMNDRSDSARASAAFLLAYTEDGLSLVNILSTRINDESPEVRNNVIRVFADLAQFHRDLELPVLEIIPILDYPETTDRNKAAAVLLGIVSHAESLSRYHRPIMQLAVPILLKLLRLRQPNNHDFAYFILQRISGRTFGERDYDAWEKWFRGQSRD